jgi:peptidoglycan/LPS O-acetylase OafA/YrhL
MIGFSDLARRFGRITTGKSYVPQIDGLRFLSLMAILFFHAALQGVRNSADPAAGEQFLYTRLPAGYFAVQLFFFISGYIISYPFLTNRPPSLSKFYKRRLLRLEPPYIVAMLGCFLILTQYNPDPINAPNFAFTTAPLWQSLVASLTYTHSLIFGEHPRLNPPTWTLELEIQFYLLAPFLLRAYLLVKRRDLRLYFGGALCLALVILGHVINAAFDWENPIRHTLLADSYGFVLGILACDYFVAAQPFTQTAQRRYDLCLAVGYIGLITTGMFEYNLSLPGAIVNTTVRAICLLLVFIGAARGPMGRAILSTPWITLIGGATYSIYLVHLPLMHAAGHIIAPVLRPTSPAVAMAICWAVLIPFSIAGGMIFYACIEHPCLRPDWPRDLVQASKAWWVRWRSPPVADSSRPDMSSPA